MIYEFAVDPEAIVDFKDFRYIYDSCGVCKGKLISQYPKNWKRRVYDACRKYYSDSGGVKLNSIEERLKRIDSLLIRRPRKYDGENLDWIQNAMKEHEETPFRAVITTEKSKDNDYVLSIETLDDTNNLWHVDTDQVCNRDVYNLTKCLLPLFEISKEIKFIDPNFNPCKERFRNTLQSFLREIVNVNPGVTDVEYHTITPLPENMTDDDFDTYSNTLLPEVIPKNMSLHIYVWDKRIRGETMHARYILTDKGGISIDYGLDEADGVGHAGETTDVRILGNGVYRRRWEEFKNPDRVFEKCIDDLIIEGRCGG